MKNQSKSSPIIWFGHYPSSFIVSKPKSIRPLMKRGTAYLSGHLHTAGHFVPQMYTRQREGFLELELADWKKERVFRIAAFDHTFFTFRDIKHKTWPLILVTNPKDTLFLILGQENPESILRSTHIR